MRRFLALMGLAAALATAMTLASAFARTSEAVTWADPAGDAGGDGDITQVSIDTDLATGAVTFAVTVTGFDPAGMDGRAREIQVYLATDATWATGFADLALIVEAGSGGLVPYVGHPKPGSWPFEPLPSTIAFVERGNVLTWTFSKTEFGEADGFNFLMYTQIAASAGAAPTVIADHAPDGVGRAWRYHYLESRPEPTTSTPVVVKPVFGPPTIVPMRPIAGKRLVFSLPVRRSDSGAPFTTGRMVCDPSIAGVLVKHAESFRNGIARLSLRLPETAKGKLLKVRVTIRDGAQSATKVATYRVT